MLDDWHSTIIENGMNAASITESSANQRQNNVETISKK